MHTGKYEKQGCNVGWLQKYALFLFDRALKKFPGGAPGRTVPVKVLFTGPPALVSKEPVYLPCCSATVFSMSSKKGQHP